MFGASLMLRYARSVHKSDIIHYVPTDCRIRQIHTISSTDYPGYRLPRALSASYAMYQDWIMYGKGDKPGLRAIGKRVKLQT